MNNREAEIMDFYDTNCVPTDLYEDETPELDEFELEEGSCPECYTLTGHTSTCIYELPLIGRDGL